MTSDICDVMQPKKENIHSKINELCNYLHGYHNSHYNHFLRYFFDLAVITKRTGSRSTRE